MKDFTFEAKDKSVLIGFMVLGLICMGWTIMIDDEYLSRFWSNFLHNSAFFTGIAFLSLFVMTAFISAYAGWYTVMKRVWEAYSLFLIPGLVLMLIVAAGLWGHFHHLYHWADAESVANDVILQGKAAFLNPTWYTFGTLIIVGAWIFFALRLRSLSIEEDNCQPGDYSIHKKMRFVAAVFLPIAAFASPAIVWLWIMSVDAHWYSTLFAWYSTASWFIAMVAITILTLIFLKGRGYFQMVSEEHFHDLGKYMFGFSVFWTYLWFSQYMLIWYSNNGEETVYFQQRINEYPVLFYGNLLINFVLPFLVLMRNDTKRKFGTLTFVSVMLIFGHWWDFFLMIKPGVLHTVHEVAAHGGGHGHGDGGHHGDVAHHVGEAAHHASEFTAGFTIPGLLEIGTFLGFFAFFVYFFFSRMAQVPLEPSNDPYLEESLHHHV